MRARSLHRRGLKKTLGGSRAPRLRDRRSQELLGAAFAPRDIVKGAMFAKKSGSGLWKQKCFVSSCLHCLCMTLRTKVFFRFWCRVKTIIVNTRQVKPLWWEDLLFPKRSLQNVPEMVTIPKGFVDSITLARDAAMDMTEGVTTLQECIKRIKKKAKIT